MAKRRLTTQEQVVDLTQKIAALGQRRTVTENAPLHQTEGEEQLIRDHNRQVDAGLEHLRRHAMSYAWPAPTTGLLPDLRTIERDGAPHLHSAGLQNMLAALFGDRLLEMKLAELREFYSTHTGLTVSAAERSKLLAEIDAEIHALEIERELIITANGLSRCADASPAAILGVKPGAPLPYDFRSSKAQSLLREAEAARTSLASIREEMGPIQLLIGRLEGDVSGFRPDSIPERLAADLKMAKQDLADLQQQLAARQIAARTLNTVAARVNQYVADYRAPRPCSSNGLNRPINPSAQNNAA